MTRAALVVLAAALACACGSRPTPTPTEEESVRAAFRRVTEAALADDFAREWECFGTTARTYWSDQHARWRALDAGSETWAELEAEHGLTRDEVLELDVRGFFVACREGQVRLFPEEWAEQKRVLRSLGLGVVEFQGDRSASLTFDLHVDPDLDVHSQAFRFEKEDEEWRFFERGAMSIAFRQPEWNEPMLELAWAHGAVQLYREDIGLVVNVLVDRGVVVSGDAVDEAALRERLALRAEDEEGVVFRCDARIPYRVAAQWIGLLTAVGVRRVVCAVTEVEGGQSTRPTPDAAGLFFQTFEHRLDYDPPKVPVAPEALDAVIDVGLPAMDADARDRLTAHFAAIADAREGARVLVSPSGDATWDAVVRVLAALRAGQVQYAVLTEPARDDAPDGVRVDGRWPPGPDGAGAYIAPGQHPASRRILGGR